MEKIVLTEKNGKINLMEKLKELHASNGGDPKKDFNGKTLKLKSQMMLESDRDVSARIRRGEKNVTKGLKRAKFLPSAITEFCEDPVNKEKPATIKVAVLKKGLDLSAEGEQSQAVMAIKTEYKNVHGATVSNIYSLAYELVDESEIDSIDESNINFI